MMLIDSSHFRLAVSKSTNERTPGGIAGTPTPVALTDAAARFLDEQDLSPHARHFFDAHCYEHSLTIGPLVFISVNEFPEENMDEVNARCIGEGLLIVGIGLNGDPIVLDLRNGLRVGFVKHEELWDEEESPARNLLVSSTLDLGTFYLAAALDETFPVDACDAEALSVDDWERFRSVVNTQKS